MKTNDEAQKVQGNENAKGKANVVTAAKGVTTQKETTPKILTIKEQLEKELEKLKRRKELADKREFFLYKKEQLLKYKEDVTKDLGELETRHAKITFYGKNEYGQDNDRVNVNNPDFIVRYIDYLVADIDAIVLQIETELLTDAA